MARTLIATVFGMILSVLLSTVTLAQETPEVDRTVTGGAQTLEDMMARQRGEPVDDTFRSGATGDPDSAASMANQLGTLGGSSDPESRADVPRRRSGQQFEFACPAVPVVLMYVPPLECALGNGQRDAPGFTRFE